MNGMLPFAVVGSMDEVKVGNRMVRARQYPWGTVQVRFIARVSNSLQYATKLSEKCRGPSKNVFRSKMNPTVISII